MKKQTTMTEGSIIKQLLLFTVPILLTNLFQNFYNAMDSVIVGKFAENGKLALGAVGSTGSLFELFIGLFIGISSGACVVVAQNYGGGNKEGVSKTVHTSIVLSIIIGIITTVIGVIFSPSAIRLMKSPHNIAPLAEEYLRILFIGMLPTTVYNFGAGILRAAGDSVRPLIYLLISSGINVVFNFIFVVYFGMSVDGVGWSTVIAQTISAIMVIVRLCRTEDCYKLSFKKLRIHKSFAKNIITIGIPSGMQTVVFSFANVIIQSQFNVLGETVVAARAAVSKIESILWAVASSFGLSATTFAGQNKGARKYDRVKKGMWICVAVSSLCVFIASAITILLRKPILSIFNSDPDVLSAGSEILTAMACCYFMAAFMEVMAGTIRGAGAPLFSMIATFIGVLGIRVSWVLIMEHIFPENVIVIILSYPVSWLAVCSALFVFYKKFRNRWLYN